MKSLLLRPLLQLLSIGFVLASFSVSATTEEWSQFKQIYIQDNGRVTDIFNNQQTHSEGQGMGMLMAAQYEDLPTFELIWGWTQENLQKREDKLFAWSWYPTSGISDMNNASDGDILIAWGLLKAYKKWHSPRYLKAALEICESIRTKLLRKTTYGIVLLPGSVGFETSKDITINLSYWIFPAFNDFAKLDPFPDWQDLSQTGLDLIKKAKFGKWGLPPNWLLITNNSLRPSKDFRFGYDAVRIPLYLIWGNQANDSNLKNFQDFWKSFQNQKRIPSWTNLQNNDVGEYNAGIGFHNISKLVLGYPDYKNIDIIGLVNTNSYYSYMLTLFTESALEEQNK